MPAGNMNNVKTKDVITVIVLVSMLVLVYKRTQEFVFLTDSGQDSEQTSGETSSEMRRLLPPLNELANPNEVAKHLFDYITNPQHCCRKLHQYGGIMYPGNKLDGDKFVCQDHPYTWQPKNCLVYSVGISNEWSFDKQVISYGCEVHAFDPSMVNFRLSKTNFGASFYRIGLSGKTQRRTNGWQMSTLSDLRIRLGHTNRLIDYLKIDIEGGEWDFLQHDMKSLYFVRQLAMEIHMTRTASSLRRYYKIFHRLQQIGFRTVHSEANRVHGPNGYVAGVPYMVGSLYEIVWVNTALDKLVVEKSN